MVNLKTILFLLLLGACFVRAQEIRPPFIQYKKNVLLHGKDSSLTIGFFRKMDEMKNGKRQRITILHYGGSHIQAGFWTEIMNNRFQQLNNYEGGGAFVFPFKLAKTNGPPFYRSFSNAKWKRCRCVNHEYCSDFGMAGISVITADSCGYFGIRLTANEHLKNFQQIKVYHNFNPAYQLNIADSTQNLVQRIDSASAGYSLFVLRTPIDSVQFLFYRKNPDSTKLVLYGFSIENNAPGFYYGSMGVNGAASDSYLKCQLLKKQLQTIKPDLVIFSLGVNDTQSKSFDPENYKANYDSLVAIIRSVSPDCALIFCTISDNFIRKKNPNKKSVLAQQAVFQLMEKHRAAAWDLYTIMGGFKSIQKWYKAKLAAKDRVHFNAKGYTLVGDLMFDALFQSYKRNSIFY